MITRITLPILAAGLLFFGCGSNTVEESTMQAAADVVRTVQEVSISSGTPVSTADISIDGMSCEMMCGGAIKKALAKLPGITDTEIKFVEGDQQDHAIVSYDEAKVTDKQIVETIQSLHDGQYKVLAVQVTKQVKGATSSIKEKCKPKDAAGLTASCAPNSSILLPSLFAILSRILVH